MHYYCGLHLEPILVDKHVQKNTNTYIYHPTPMYVPETNMPVK